MTLLATLVVFAALLWWAGPGWRPRSLPGVTRSRPWRIGHRGTRTVHPENTIEALEEALRRLDGIETDVRRTADGRFVLFHDDAVGSLRVAKADAEVLRDRHPGLATLDELFALSETYPDRLLNLELKTEGGVRPLAAFERAFVRAVRASGCADRVLVSSFDPLALARVRLLAPSLRVALLTAPEAPRILRDGALARWLHVDALHPHVDQVHERLLTRADERGLPLHVWTVNDPDRMRALADAGVAGLIGDDPGDLVRYVRPGTRNGSRTGTTLGKEQAP